MLNDYQETLCSATVVGFQIKCIDFKVFNPTLYEVSSSFHFNALGDHRISSNAATTTINGDTLSVMPGVRRISYKNPILFKYVIPKNKRNILDTKDLVAIIKDAGNTNTHGIDNFLVDVSNCKSGSIPKNILCGVPSLAKTITYDIKNNFAASFQLQCDMFVKFSGISTHEYPTALLADNKTSVFRQELSFEDKERIMLRKINHELEDISDDDSDNYSIHTSDDDEYSDDDSNLSFITENETETETDTDTENETETDTSTPSSPILKKKRKLEPVVIAAEPSGKKTRR